MRFSAERRVVVWDGRSLLRERMLWQTSTGELYVTWDGMLCKVVPSVCGQSPAAAAAQYTLLTSRS